MKDARSLSGKKGIGAVRSGCNTHNEEQQENDSAHIEKDAAEKARVATPSKVIGHQEKGREMIAALPSSPV
jgi:hypothetical protein